MYLRMFLVYSLNAKDDGALTIYIPEMLADDIYCIYCLQNEI
jgi:hypothetical protein